MTDQRSHPRWGDPLDWWAFLVAFAFLVIAVICAIAVFIPPAGAQVAPAATATVDLECVTTDPTPVRYSVTIGYAGTNPAQFYARLYTEAGSVGAAPDMVLSVLTDGQSATVPLAAVPPGVTFTAEIYATDTVTHAWVPFDNGQIIHTATVTTQCDYAPPATVAPGRTPPGRLPDTGSGTAWLVIVGLGALAVGLGAIRGEKGVDNVCVMVFDDGMTNPEIRTNHAGAAFAIVVRPAGFYNTNLITLATAATRDEAEDILEGFNYAKASAR